MGELSEYNFILDSSSLERGLGNIKRWCKDCQGKVVLRLYIPTYTLQELDFLRYRRKSFGAREALKFVDQATGEYPNLIVEFPETLDMVLWSEVTSLVDGKHVDALNKLPRRFKNLLKSCIYKCKLEENPLKWILVSEDPRVRQQAELCDVPWCSLVDADSTLAKETNTKQFFESQKFNNLVEKRGTGQSVVGGKRVVRTEFDNTVYASRGRGSLWEP
ncbi:NMD4 (YLR363C) [Zygosaccharomyces parabailii]|uniref:BN860_15940g1_1 n=1 Tax=Zygosaccharomyces bailii (strain CLIB 213 / ATCC 58445 / CBS 680 / BCRC 21525 / NBRC 1098 / NCYC 1416 / NRRL Y-2227) TaxID=1333698 RepID=A0A8J2T4P9_ZYGB2|nr:NMD4 (YLR363C) [Zygosaccharomyces parabailii]CDF87853.1 BN860_15940g1_1 [Zygosaccharomyces bailii CLIB 213]CDH17910.1 probable Nonsense-mediated decay protein 4 [Zygosaccharomyces bailii ISA1307]